MVTQPDDPQQAQAWVRGSAPDAIVDFYIPRGNQGLPGPRGPMGPGVTVGSVVVTNGPAAPGTLGPIGLTGAKGDPGGFTAGTSLSTNDLNTITADGIYKQATSANATLAANYPIAGVVGLMFVNQISATFIQQIFYPGSTSSSRAHYVRVMSSGVWQPWRAFGSQRVDQTAGRAIYKWDDVNQREQLVYGDTGSRDISTLKSAAISTTQIWIRRVGTMVTLHIHSLTFSAAGTGAVAILPASALAGFIPVHVSRGVLTTAVAGETRIVEVAIDGTVNVYGPTATAGYSGMITYDTSSAWPTTLPGAAVGTVPNI
jgi:hypothetical protein